MDKNTEKHEGIKETVKSSVALDNYFDGDLTIFSEGYKCIKNYYDILKERDSARNEYYMKKIYGFEGNKGRDQIFSRAYNIMKNTQERSVFTKHHTEAGRVLITDTLEIHPAEAMIPKPQESIEKAVD